MGKSIKKEGEFEWIDLENPSEDELSEITYPFSIDINVLEDSLERGHLPKIEKLNDFTFIILRAHSTELDKDATTVGELSNKIAFFINPGHLLTIHRAKFEFLNIKEESYNDNERLMLDLINELLLTYEKPMDMQSDLMDEFEKDIFLRNGPKDLIKALYLQKTKARVCKKILQLTQAVLYQMTVKEENSSALQDLKETTISYLLHYDEIVENANTLLHSYMSVTAQKNNEVMKLLTVFSAFFLPLTFIAGIYGMNFENMPELDWKNGYYYTWGLMILISVLIYVWFKRKRIL